MDKKIKFYTVSFVDQMGEPNELSVKNFLNNLESLFLQDKLKTPSESYGKNVYMFKFVRSDINPNEEFIIPFGTLKQNTPYQVSSSNPKEITPSNVELYDINLFYYNANENIAAITCDRVAPNNKVISAFLSNYINSEKYMLSIKPILYETGIEVIRNSRSVKSVTLTIDLDKNVEQYYNDNINTDSSVFRQLLILLRSAKREIENRTFKLELGLGRSKKESMNKENTLSLLTALDLTSDVIREVSLNYVGGGKENIEVAKLKKQDIELNETIPHEGKGSLLAGEMLAGITGAIESNRRVINNRIREFERRRLNVDDESLIKTGENNDSLPEEIFA